MGKLYRFILALVTLAICMGLVGLGLGMIVVGLLGTVNPAGNIALVGCGVLTIFGVIVGTSD